MLKSLFKVYIERFKKNFRKKCNLPIIRSGKPILTETYEPTKR